MASKTPPSRTKMGYLQCLRKIFGTALNKTRTRKTDFFQFQQRRVGHIRAVSEIFLLTMNQHRKEPREHNSAKHTPTPWTPIHNAPGSAIGQKTSTQGAPKAPIKFAALTKVSRTHQGCLRNFPHRLDGRK